MESLLVLFCKHSYVHVYTFLYLFPKNPLIRKVIKSHFIASSFEFIHPCRINTRSLLPFKNIFSIIDGGVLKLQRRKRQAFILVSIIYGTLVINSESLDFNILSYKHENDLGSSAVDCIVVNAIKHVPKPLKLTNVQCIAMRRHAGFDLLYFLNS